MDNQAATLATYARMSQNTELENLARKVRAQATFRLGEMLAAYKSKGGRPRFHDDLKTTVGDHPSFSEPPRSQREAAESAGISPHQARQAINVSRIDRRQFEEVLEGRSHAKCRRPR